jgi:D-glycero-D-manno-heptose 1,7-bisphosphate phosphatase
MLNPALILDRDGVINYDYGYVHTREKFDFIEGIFEVARYAYEQKHKLIIITNQSGIGRGYYNEKDFHLLTGWMCQQFLNAGAPIDRVYFSPCHPTDGVGPYAKDDYFRKPHPGMILQAQKDFSIDLTRSVLVGDKVTDIQAGDAAGVGTNLLFADVWPFDSIKVNCNLITSIYDVIPFIKKCK